MKVHISVLRCAPILPMRLNRDGWVLEFEADGSMTAYHPEASTSAQARERLSRLDILTSAGLRIDFALTDGPGKRRQGPKFLSQAVDLTRVAILRAVATTAFGPPARA